ncbi:fumarate hydratase [Tissierella creatinophila]|uniref:L(+)-tartrate dehydratase subunit alpha n=1 Tax=Tissierella creatinophila DSM 6911 TaxID=1123403 RepID=A0A1U7M6L8_TISCR|nr:fumarate hydratase [Tissierella creatinophila]OLS02931.1 L(+)-tartrate dehydratase subunit alpha [Tissierella creatinophila DSM 6911]
MREIHADLITKEVKRLVMEANFFLPEDVLESLKRSKKDEKWELASNTLGKIIENAKIAKDTEVPMCQDTGMVVAFVEIGQDIHVINGSIEDAVNEGVRQGYEEGYLRKSIVKDPLDRVNTKDNTPAVIHYNIVPGDKMSIIISPKGFGSENMSRIKMLKPTEGIDGVKDFVLETVSLAGPNPCPPIIVGVGIGGTFEKAALLAKKSLMRNVDQYSSDSFYENLEKQLLKEINDLGIGPQGFGGKTTALKVNIETFPTHIAGLPVAVNISCHATRHKQVIL